MNIEKIDRAQCYSCGNCEVSCPKHCITMSADARGFIYPIVNKSQCIECGLCLKVCPANDVEQLKHSAQESCYSLVSNDLQIFKAASSGGAFITIVKAFLSRSPGQVYGAVYTNEHNVCHICCDNLKDCFAFSKSKYVKSDIYRLLPQIRKQLVEGENVLFSGTPCQVAALRKYLNNEYDNLITVDFVCGGVPGVKFFKSYLRDFGEPVSSVTFRADNGINKRNLIVNFLNGKSEMISIYKDVFLRAFSENLTQMESCFNCDFCSKERVSDITLGDFWGLQKVNSQANPDKGISLVITNTEKGRNLLFETENAEIQEYPIKVATDGNPRLYCRIKKNEHFYIFADYVDKYGFEKAVLKVLGRPPQQSLIIKIKTKIKRIIEGI